MGSYPRSSPQKQSFDASTVLGAGNSPLSEKDFGQSNQLPVDVSFEDDELMMTRGSEDTGEVVEGGEADNEVKFDYRGLKQAVKEWGQDRVKAEKKYGHIVSWDVSAVISSVNVSGSSNLLNSYSDNLRESSGKFNNNISGWDLGRVEDMQANYWETENVDKNMMEMLGLRVGVQ
ncbi:hypothetical protein TL16_g13130 [Triparma laevis f. inornata]|uniref:Uncharacterized protein n=1 Tax=Triparma laevis f. inornata TaxID=1714386 RepID=A0A9W7BQ03_9STRA|nr:hypothetical protein TL16_g13130 [Triparma laevis f. inornata]